MSYNIENSNIKRISNFKIPLRKLFVTDNVIIKLERDYVYVAGAVEGFEINGTINNQCEIEVEGIAYYGSFSGAWYENFKHILKSSTGYLKILLVWEDGAIDMLIVDDGEISFTELSELQ